MSKKETGYYHNDNLFTGVIIETHQGVVVKKSNCFEGKITDNYKNPYFVSEDNLQLTEEVITLYRDEQVLYQGEPYTGTVYYFVNNVCYQEVQYIHGWEESNIGYELTGAISNIEVSEPKQLQFCEWHSSSQLARYYISVLKSFSLEVKLNTEGKITSIGYNCLGEADSTYYGTIYFPSLLELTFSKLTAAKRLCLFGNKINDEIFHKMAESNFLIEVEDLHIGDCKVKLPCIFESLSNTKIENIDFSGGYATIKDLIPYKNKYHGYKVTLDQKQRW